MRRIAPVAGIIGLAGYAGACADRSGGDVPGTSPIDVAGDAAADAPTPPPGATDAGGDAPACDTSLAVDGARPRYGRHYPNGAAAVAYAFGANGFWKEMKPLEYTDNYYEQYATPTHPFDQAALVGYANGTHFTTARDANGHLLFDADHDGELDPQPGGTAGFAFHEHAGRGAGGAVRGTPFTNFWFDDNWLARYMTDAWARPAPNGLSSWSDFTRWRILGGDRTNWTPYGSSFFDTLALDGLYAAAGGDTAGALAKWDAIRTQAGATYDSATQRFLYPNIHESYHLGLFAILTATLEGARADLLDHGVAIRSDMLSIQETDAATGAPLGWRSDVTQAGSLMNIESLAVSVLGLGAGAAATFEPGVLPMRADATFFVRPHHVISAVAGMSSPGLLTDGPGLFVAPSAQPYEASFFLRAPSPTGTMAHLEIADELTGAVLASRDVAAADMAAANAWTRITLSFAPPPAACNRIALRTRWTGAANLDAGPIRVR